MKSILVFLLSMTLTICCFGQSLRFNSDTVFSYSNGIRVNLARVSLSFSANLPLTIYPLAELSPAQRQKILNLLARQPELAGYIKLWSDEVHQVPESLPYAEQRASSKPDHVSINQTKEANHSLRKAGASLIFASSINPLAGIVVTSMTRSGYYSGATTVAILSGLSSLVGMIRAGGALIQASEEISVE
jgi:hypothetical protein